MNPAARDPASAQRPLRGSAFMLAAATAWCRVEAYAAALASRRNHRSIARIFDSAHWLSAALFGESLTSVEKSRLTVKIYESSPTYRNVGTSLFAEEEALFARRLPSPPARVLVGACGTGREAVALVALGYRVLALEPALEAAAESRRRLDGRAPVLPLSYEQLSAIVLERGSSLSAAERDLASARFDAVLLGCGSLSHVLEQREQRRLLQAVDRLCPAGPIVASFLWVATDGDPQTLEGRQKGRAARVGQRIGSAIGRMRGVTLGETGRLNYRAQRGFAYTFVRREVEALASAVGRRVIWERRDDRPSQYATFLPAATTRPRLTMV